MGILGDVFKIGSSLIGGSSAKKASKKAQAAQIAGLNNAVAGINTGFDQSTAALNPYTTSGAGAIQGLDALLGISTPGSAGTVDWAKYVQGNPDALANWNAIQNTPAGQQFGGDIGKFGQYHYNADGARRDLTPFTVGGTDAVDGNAAQASAIAGLENSPLFESLMRNGQEAILQNGAATGGLRGGNIQSSLANFGRDTLSQVIQQQIANLSGVAQGGLSAATSQAGMAGDKASALARLFTQQGDTNAGGILQRSTINTNMINGVAKGLGSIADGGGFGKIASSIAGFF